MIKARKYRRGGLYPIELEAIQYTGQNGSEIELWLGVHFQTKLNLIHRLGGKNAPSDFGLNIPGAGEARASDYVVKNLDETVVILNAEDFEKAFEPIEQNTLHLKTLNAVLGNNALGVSGQNNPLLSFIKKFSNGHRIVSTNDLTEFQIAEAREENRLYVDELSGLGWIALPWDITTLKDRNRERNYLRNEKVQA